MRERTKITVIEKVTAAALENRIAFPCQRQVFVDDGWPYAACAYSAGHKQPCRPARIDE